MSAEKLAALQLFYPAAQVLSEGGQAVILLQGLEVDTPKGAIAVDALLYPALHTGYSTRLFISQQITAPHANNWTSHAVCGKTWWACSWQGVGAELAWIDMIANHMRAFR